MSSVKGWKKCRVRDICNLGRGRVISAQEIERNPGVYPVYSSQSLNNGIMGSIDTFDFNGECITWTTDGAYAG
ncbi:MAG: restriction endonuclease subunit S, partial [Smithellaceae bacterium]